MMCSASRRLWFLSSLVVILLLFREVTASEHREREEDDDRHDEPSRRKDSPFVLKEPKVIAETDAGDVRVLPGPHEFGALARNNIGLTMISMEPKALLLPQYLDASCVLYVHKGQMTIGWIERGELNKQDLETGDVYALEGGLAFYILNTDEAQRLRVYSMCDTSESLETGHFQSFFLGGGEKSPSVLAGFDKDVLGAAYKADPEDVVDMLTAPNEGPIVYTTRSEYEFLKYSSNDASTKPFSLLKKSPDFKNENGWTIAVDGEEFSPLQEAGVGVFAVSLKPGAMLAPHSNPRAAEVSFITKGRGTIQVSYPNGTSALNKEVDEGTVVFVPRYFPMCQIASRDGPFEFVGFSTSSRPNRPQFFAGSTSVFNAMQTESDVLSKALGVSQKRLEEFIGSQSDAVILAGFTEENGKSDV